MAFASTTHNKQSTLKRRKRNRLILYGVLVSCGIALLVGAGAYVSGIPQFLVQTVAISGNTVTDGMLIEDVVRSELKGRYLGLFSKENSFLFPRRAIERAVLSEFQRVRSVEVARKGLNTVIVVVEERKPRALWCEGNTPFLKGKSLTECYFLDNSGFIFSHSPDFSRNVFVRYFGGVSATNTIGSFFAQAQFAEYDFFVQSLRGEKLPISDMVLLHSGDIELYLESGVKILFEARQDLGTILSNIKLLIEREELALLSTTPRFEYIDLRYGNKVFYKSKGSTQ